MQAHTCRLCKLTPCQKYAKKNNFYEKNVKVECQGYIQKIHLPCSSFLKCVLWEALITRKTRACTLLSYVSIRITKQDFCGLCSYIAALGETSEVRMAFPFQLRTCFGLCLLSLTLVSLLHRAGNRTPKQLISVDCSALSLLSVSPLPIPSVPQGLLWA